MDISKLKIFNLLQTNMNYLGTKQDLLAENVSNANTPGYEGKTLAPLDFKSILQQTAAQQSSQLAMSNPRHIAFAGGVGNSPFRQEAETDVFEVTPMGNKVVMEQEVMKVAKNSMEYQQTTSIYRKMLGMMRTAIGDNS